MLFGRGAECGLLDVLLERAGAGESAALLVRGEAGIGKSALLDHARGRAEELGFTTLEARGVEGESEVPFAGISELFRPVLDLLDRLPSPQQSALATALAL